MEAPPVTAPAASIASSPAAPDRSAVLASDFDTFLRLLTTQARNQDPLDPLDATDYATQLATFSSVEQQVQTNDLLREIGVAIRGSTLETLRGWTGAQVLVAAAARFDGSPLRVHPDVAEEATSATLTVRDEDGNVVAREALDPGTSGGIDWVGRDTDGAPLPPGRYTFETLSFRDGEVVATRPARVYADVVEARQDPDGTIRIVLEDGQELSEAEAGGIRVRG
ncbi:flagellar hook capping FlgD N-terminal domain-containing protein [Roseivivax isoporae]|uniref:Basal-body rod modification protein FlgD n=1 Tax=Roseivivax isoporae LMG 25204 TaxID=1449351 RepID=X7F9W7_9RHOB|nr:flagellar hook capping FlgD N-terminal domain-containing protein [Roseivivax isoporae]ETX29702.1 FlgD protein [Roseivivax isoporae LMG 25204]